MRRMLRPLNLFLVLKPDIFRFLKGCQTSGQLNFRALITILYVGIFLSGCSYRTTAVEQPPPNNQAVSKSFFIQTIKDPKTGKTREVPRSFLCGWASETEVGEASEAMYTNNVVVPEHCNIVFDITENELVGKVINPSFPDDSSRWEVAMTIPIKKHYYLEFEKDARGRDTSTRIENATRSHWSARPYVDLDLTNINFDYKWGFGGGLILRLLNMGKGGTYGIEDIEWDFKNNFLGFTLSKGSWGPSINKVRFNFLAFDHNPSFKKTPFNDQNYKRMNVLHIIGEKVKGLYPILHAAHWDSTKTHEIRLWGFPNNYAAVAEEVINDWNEVLSSKEVGVANKQMFKINKEPTKHAFDLRYPTIAWIADEKISSYSPLGVGMALADVKNGEIKWGMITLYGGMIEAYMKSYTASAAGKTAETGILSKLLKNKSLPQSLDLPAELKQISSTSRLSLSKDQSEQIINRINESLIKKVAEKPIDKTKKEAQSKETQIKENPAFSVDLIQSIYGSLSEVTQAMSDKVRLQNASQTYSQILKKVISPNYSEDETAAEATRQAVQGAFAPKQSMSIRDQITKKYSGPTFCTERRFVDIASEWAAARADLGRSDLLTDKQVLRKIVKELIAHEYGHFLGLGHQFKENILPRSGSVPESIYNSLAAKATAEKGYTNYTSVMGYRNPRSEIAEAEEVKPGPQDKLVLAYLYNQKYATYKQGDSDFTFFDIPASGIIPPNAEGKADYKTSYFPQCNDLDASLSMDPYCNRFDRGYNAITIVQNYFSDLKDGLIPSLFAFTDARGGDPDWAQFMMWYKTLNVTGRTRLFYDYMRLTYKSEIDQIRNDEDALMEFSSGCREEQPKNAKLAEMFSKNPHLKELCQANAIVLNELKGLVSRNLVDFTKKDLEGRFTPGGLDGGDTQRDWSRFLGTWTELSGLPLKLSSLYALNTGIPWMTEFGMWGVPIYDDPNYKFSYASLYPREYTEITAANVKNNLRFASLGQNERTSMGNSVFSMSWFNYMAQVENNDTGLFPPQYIQKIRNQQRFDFSFVAIIMKGRKKDNSPGFVESFDGVVFDFNTGKETPLTNAYLMPGAEVFANASNMFLYPVTRFIPYSDTDGYLFAYKMDYYKDHTDPLTELGVKTDLSELHNQLINACVIGTEGNSNGLAQYFNGNNKQFEGFKMSPGLARTEQKRKEFLDSIKTAFDGYHKSSLNPKPQTCQESLRGLGLIISSAAIINGYWLPEVMDYIQK